MNRQITTKSTQNKIQKSTQISIITLSDTCSNMNRDNNIPENKFTQIDSSYRFKDLDSYVCIPVSIDKKPAISWKNVTETPKHLFQKDHNIALLTGKINGITVIDVDQPKLEKKELDGMKMISDLLKIHNNGKSLDIPTCKTQSGGIHYYFKYDADIKTSTGINGYSIDIRNDSGIIIAPPSIGIKGPYVWANNSSLTDIELTEIPTWLKQWLLLANKPKKLTSKIAVKENIQHSYKINKGYVFIYDTAKIIDLLNKLPNKYLTNYSDWFIITSCLKSEDLFVIWDNWSRGVYRQSNGTKSKRAKSKGNNNYDESNNINQWNSFIPTLNINYLYILAKKEGIDIEPNIIRSTKKINFLTAKPDLQINKQYIDKNDIVINNNDRDSMLVNAEIVKSGCGTGKTTFACASIGDLVQNNNYQFMSLSVRVSLAYQQVSNFSAKGKGKGKGKKAKDKLIVSNYKDITNKKQLNEQRNLVVQVDSLTKIYPKSWQNNVIYLDEVSCLLSYVLTSSTLNGKRMQVFNTLCDLVTKASKILVTDADVNDMVLTFFDKLKINYHLIENVYKKPIKIKAYEYSSKELLLRKIEQQFLTNEPIIVCFDSKKEMDMVVQRMKKFCEDYGLTKQLNNFLVYSSTEGDDNDFFCVNGRWRGKFIFITPKVTIGVDYSNSIPQNVYLIGLGNSINSIAFIQQISRCRNMKGLFYYVANKYQYLKYDSVYDVKTYYQGIIGDYNNLCCENVSAKTTAKIEDDSIHLERTDYEKLKIIIDTGNATRDFTKNNDNWVFSESLFNDLYFYNEYYDNILRSAPRQQFRWMLEGKNYEIEYNNEEIEEVEKADIIKGEILSKERVNLNNDQQSKRALYNKPTSLTVNEKKLREDAERRAKYLNIDFNKKVQKKKYEKYLTSDVEFTRHIAYKLLIGDESKLDSKIAASLEKDYKITICNSLETKVKLIKKVEKILEIETLDIDTQRDMGRFEEDIVIDDGLLKLLKKTFRITKADNKIANSFEHLYYELIQLYKNVLGNDICCFKKTKVNNINHKQFNTNLEVLNEHIELDKLI